MQPHQAEQFAALWTAAQPTISAFIRTLIQDYQQAMKCYNAWQSPWSGNLIITINLDLLAHGPLVSRNTRSFISAVNGQPISTYLAMTSWSKSLIATTSMQK